MEIWKILGIDPTRDEEAIEDAYYEKLAVTNPEDKPEEFKALRAAYEQALEQARAPQEDEGGENAPKTPLEQWLERVQQAYDDLDLRRDEAHWRELLEDPVCFSLGGRLEARDGFLIQCGQRRYLLPNKIWKLLDEYFDFHGSRAELYEKFPKNYINLGILNAIDNPEFIRFDKFTEGTGAQADEYIIAANRFRRAYENDDREELAAALGELETQPAKHPFTWMAEARVHAREEDWDAALDCCDRYLAACPEDIGAWGLHAKFLSKHGNYVQAEQELRRANAQDPANKQVQYDLCCVLELQHRYAEAKEILYDLQRADPHNEMLADRCDHINEAMLPVLLQRRQEAPQDLDNLLQLVWLYLQQNKLEQAWELAQQLPAEEIEPSEYENLMGKLLFNRKAYGGAWQHLQKWEQSIRALDPDHPKTAKRRTRLTESRMLQAEALSELGRREEADALLTRLEREQPDNWEVVAAHLWVLRALERNKKAEELLDRWIETGKPGAEPYYFRGIFRFRAERFGPAWQDFRDYEELAGEDLTCSGYCIRILLMVGQQKDAFERLDELKDVPNGINAVLDFCRARRMEEEGDRKGAAELYRSVIERVKAEPEQMELPGELFFRYGVLMDSHPDSKTPEKVEELIALLKEGRSLHPTDLRLQDLLAFELKKQRRYAEAADVYRDMLTQAPDDSDTLEQLAELYRSELKQYNTALPLYRTLVEKAGAAAHYAGLGKCLQELLRFDEAEEAFRRAMELEPRQPAWPADLGGLYLAMNRLPEAKAAFEAALALPGAQEGFYRSVRDQLARTLMRMCDFDNAREQWFRNARTDLLDDLTEAADAFQTEGRYEEALLELDRWKARQEHANETWYLRRRAAYLRSAGREKEARAILDELAAKTVFALDDLSLWYFDNGHYKKAVELGKKVAETAPDNDYFLGHLAKYYWFAGKRQQAVELSRQGLTLLEERRSNLERAMYFTRRAEFLIWLGEWDEAAHLLELAKQAPMCRTCTYGLCKDVLIFEELLYEVSGQPQQAAECVRVGLRVSPEETDFRAAAKRLAKKGVKV